MLNHQHIGSSLDDFLEEEGLLAEAEAVAAKRVLLLTAEQAENEQIEQLYQQFEKGEISLGYFAGQMGVGVRELYGTLEKRWLATSNIRMGS